MRTTSRLRLRSPQPRKTVTARARNAFDPLADSDEHRMFGGDARDLYGGHYRSQSIPNLDDLDAEFEPEEASERPLWKPEWGAWLRYNQARFDAATEHLRYIETRDDLYHYVDVRNDERYSIPTREEWDRYQVEDAEMHAVYGGRPRIWKKAIKLFLLACALTAFLGVMLASNSARDATGMPDTVIHIAFLSALIGTPVLFLLRSVSRPNPRSLPEHRMFYTDAEFAEIAAQERYERARNAAIFVGVMGFFAARRMARHFHDKG